MESYVLYSNIIKITLSILLILLFYYAFMKRDELGVIPLLFLLLFTTLYTILNILINFRIFSLDTVILFETIIRPIGMAIVFSCFYLTIEYTNNKSNRLETFYLLLFYFVFISILFGLDLHFNLLFSGFEFGADGYLVPTQTDLFFLLYILPASVLVISSIFIIYNFSIKYKLTRKPSLIIGSGLVLGYISISLDSAIDTVHQAINLDVLGVSFGVIIISIGVLHFDITEKVSINKEDVISNINETVITITKSGDITDIHNKDNIDISFGDNYIGTDIKDVFEKQNIDINNILESNENDVLKIKDNNRTKYYQIKIHEVHEKFNIFSDSDNLRGKIIIISDKTKAIKQQKQIRLQKNIFGRILRHNIKNELNIIQGRTKLIDSESDSDLTRHTDSVLKSSSSLIEISNKSQIIEDIIHDMEEYSEFKISNILYDCIGEFKNRYDGVDIIYNETNDFNFQAHPRFPHVIKEIVENGIQHNSSNIKKIKIETIIDDKDNKQVIITDNGDGIDDTELKPIFDSNQETQLEHGSSVGLWLVKFITDLSCDSIEFHKIKNGTQVIINITDT